MDREVTIVTHSGSFHTDDVFAVAAILLSLGDTRYRIERCRDAEIIKAGDFVVDVGSVYDSDKNRFDHHQQGGTGMRGNGIPYSAFGLVWKKFGEKLCGSKYAARIMEKRLVFPVDAADNGIDTYIKKSEDLIPYTLHNAVEAFCPTWKEENGRNFDTAFAEVLDIARKILLREIQCARDEEEGEKYVEQAYTQAKDKRLIVIDGQYSWEAVLCRYPEPLYVVKPEQQSNGAWKIKAVRDDPNFSFKNRKDLPKSWAGKRDKELAEVTGVSDAVFCHNKLFIAVAGSREGALKLARIAVNN